MAAPEGQPFLFHVVRKLNRKTAGLINNAPFAIGYGLRGELLSSVAQLSNPPGMYQRQDQLNQNFSNGRLIRQDEIVRDPNTGDVTLQLAARLYYQADDRLGAVQRYSYRNSGTRDGGWEDYRYDALGRRIMARVRRKADGLYDASFSGPLCQSTTITTLCRSFTERVWWDGDQALVEERIPDGTSDVSNSGLVGNIHGLTLDEPLAVVTPSTSETRIINYNWRGQALSSVYPNGQGADYSTGNAVAEIDWPAATQAETYFTPSPDYSSSSNAKKWLGTFVANGQGTTGLLYRRNRYFDPKSGRFTQEDPTGIAGGLNVYGFANGDPVNFSDPFGLCPPEDDNPRDCPGKMGALVMLGQMAPSINYEIASFLPNNLIAAVGGLGVGAFVGRVVGAIAGRSASASEQILFEGGKDAFRESLSAGIKGVNSQQTKALLKTLSEGSVDNIRLVTGENGLVSYSTRAGRNGYQTLARTFDNSGSLSKMAQAAWDRAGQFVHGEVWK
jgi:RHS repeat-associated protein